MFKFTREWAEGMIAEALVARGVPEDEARHMADMGEFLADIRDEAMERAWDEGFADGKQAAWNCPDDPKPTNPYRNGGK